MLQLSGSCLIVYARCLSYNACLLRSDAVAHFANVLSSGTYVVAYALVIANDHSMSQQQYSADFGQEVY
jgi:hypothetical protein